MQELHPALFETWICSCPNIPNFPYVVVKFLGHILYWMKGSAVQLTPGKDNVCCAFILFFTEKLNIKLSTGLLSDLRALKEICSKTQVIKTLLSAWNIVWFEHTLTSLSALNNTCFQCREWLRWRADGSHDAENAKSRERKQPDCLNPVCLQRLLP